jgi:hypothetical protein
MKHLFSFRIFESGYSGDENFIPKSMQQKRFSDISKSLNHPIHVSTDKGWWKETDDDLFIRNTDKEAKKDALVKGGMPKVEKPKEEENRSQGEVFGVELEKYKKMEKVSRYIFYINYYKKIYSDKIKKTNSLELCNKFIKKLSDYVDKLKSCQLEDLNESGLLSVKFDDVEEFLIKLKNS